MRVIGIIPARLAATRLPDKPLLDIAGKPMIQRVWERAREAVCLEEVLIATPDEAIRRAVEAFGGIAIMTSPDHRSGTDRLAEAAAGLEADVIVNIQGDEPLIDPTAIESAVAPFSLNTQHSTLNTVSMTSLMCPCPPEDLDNPACVKVVCDLAGNALYFSRARLPYSRTDTDSPVMQHVGLYAYRREFLLQFAKLPPTPLEQTESLEQLRALENGHRIRMVPIPTAPLSVDTPEDLSRVRALFGYTDIAP
jgi:3-deoxy-manno-octulosonate cytidylyltransferase (CMP-KDO synthetase)